MKRNKQAFTLIELLVVVLIIGILAAVALPQYEKAVEKSHVAEAKIILNKVRQIYQLCVLEQGSEWCNDPYQNFVPDYVQGELPGEYEEDASNCPTSASGCFKTKNWIYETDAANSFMSTRNINEEYPYQLSISYDNGDISCGNNDSDKYCPMLCGANFCTLK